MKLIWEHYITDEYSYGYTNTVPFEYSSKDDFVLEILQRCETAKKEKKKYIKIFNEEYLSIEDAERIEHDVYTLEEWFTKELQIL